ncbi:unnamed protein product [Meloidogyne enterolobii]
MLCITRQPKRRMYYYNGHHDGPSETNWRQPQSKKRVYYKAGHHEGSSEANWRMPTPAQSEVTYSGMVINSSTTINSKADYRPSTTTTVHHKANKRHRRRKIWLNSKLKDSLLNSQNGQVIPQTSIAFNNSASSNHTNSNVLIENATTATKSQYTSSTLIRITGSKRPGGTECEIVQEGKLDEQFVSVVNEIPTKSLFVAKRFSSLLTLLGTVILVLRLIKLSRVHSPTSTNGIFIANGYRIARSLLIRLAQHEYKLEPKSEHSVINSDGIIRIKTKTMCRPISIAIVLSLLGFVWTLLLWLIKGAELVCQMLAWTATGLALVFIWFNICGTTTAVTDQSKTSFLTAVRYPSIHQAGTTASATSTSFLHAGKCLCLSQAGITRAVTDQLNMNCSSVRKIGTSTRQQEVTVWSAAPHQKLEKGELVKAHFIIIVTDLDAITCSDETCRQQSRECGSASTLVALNEDEEYR